MSRPSENFQAGRFFSQINRKRQHVGLKMGRQMIGVAGLGTAAIFLTILTTNNTLVVRNNSVRC
jgi:hypothetical protein